MLPWMYKLGTPKEWIALLWMFSIFSTIVRFFMTKPGTAYGTEQIARDVAGVIMIIAIPITLIVTFMYYRHTQKVDRTKPPTSLP